MMTVEKMIAWLRDNDTPDDHETRLQIADEFEKHVNSLVISGGMYRSKQAELETALLRLDAALDDKDEAIARMLRTERRLEAVLKDLDEASPMRACARCGKEYRSHRMVWEEGDEMECLPCNERENARERAETDVAGSSPAERSTVAESFSPEERAIMREVADKLRAGIARRCHLCGHDTDDMDDHLTKHLF